jgi:hypothetical protein
VKAFLRGVTAAAAGAIAGACVVYDALYAACRARVGAGAETR